MDRTLKINLALQGGGAHGAFSWGVLDRLLDEPDIEFVGISGTSAGAMNAAALKTGWVRNGADGAREALANYWNEIGKNSPNYPDLHEEIGFWAGPFAGIWEQNLKSMGLTANLGDLDRFYSPYAHNPADINPLRDLVNAHFSNTELQSEIGPRVFINATHVNTGRIEVFRDARLSTEALLASAALPSLFKAVEIEGQHYWDGGFTGNPALFPLIDHTDCSDIVIVHINPIERDELPTTPMDIENRVNEISFNTSLIRELRHIDFVQRWMDQNNLPDNRFKTLRMHAIADDKLMNELSPMTKIFPTPNLIEDLFAHGRKSAEDFLLQHGEKIGKNSSLDLSSMF